MDPKFAEPHTSKRIYVYTERPDKLEMITNATA